MKMKTNLLAASIAAVGLASTINVQADALTEAMKASDTNVSFRLRSESVDADVDDNGSATANTLKTRFTFKSGAIAGFSVLAEVDNVSALSETDYNDGTNGKTDEQKIIDHEYTDVNQMYIQYAGFDSTVKVGNQRILLDNQRHVGGVGFRQDEATFDAVSVTNKSIPNTTIFAAAINNRHTITGGETLEDINLLNVNYKVSKALSATGYLYQVNNFNDGTVDFETTGLRLTGAVGPAFYEAEFATQTKETATTDFDTSYYNVALGAKFAGVKATLGQESKGSDEGAAEFETPLGTNHKFMGWTDVLLKGSDALGTGANNIGVVDTYASAVTTVAGVKLVGQFHSYASDEQSEDIGTEFGFVVAKKFNNYGVDLKASQFTPSKEAEDLGLTEVTKLWLTGTAKF